MSEQKRTGKPKRIPYGMMNFEHLRRDNCYFVDKTRFIEKIEDANKYFFFIRPRRFGKSLTLSMLAHYYDINMKADGMSIELIQKYSGLSPEEIAQL